jgi:hypothetical protein
MVAYWSASAAAGGSAGMKARGHDGGDDMRCLPRLLLFRLGLATHRVPASCICIYYNRKYRR